MCVLGFTIQAFYVSESYFEYKTTTAVSIQNQRRLPPTALSVCIYYINTIDRDNLLFSFNESVRAKLLSLSNYPVLLHSYLFNHITVKNALEITRNISLGSCRVMFPGNLTVNDYRDCSKAILVSKLLYQIGLCYRLQLDVDYGRQYDYEILARLMANNGLAFRVELNLDIQQIEGIMPVLHTADSDGELSRLYAPAFVTKSQPISYFRLTYGIHREWSLPKPYQTACYMPKEGEEYIDDLCLKNCRVQMSMQHFNRLPFTDIYSLDDKILNHSMLDNLYFDQNTLEDADVRKTFEHIMTHCRKKCPYNCQYIYHLTHVQQTIYTNQVKKSITFRVNLPLSPTTTIIHKPFLQFNEFLIYLLSCLGTWLGVSVIQLNPFTFKRNVSVCVSEQFSPITRNFTIREVPFQRITRRIRVRPLAPPSSYFQRAHGTTTD